VQVRRIADMTNDARLEVRVPSPQRQELEQLAADTGLSVGGLVRLATRRLLDDRTSLLKGTEAHAGAPMQPSLENKPAAALRASLGPAKRGRVFCSKELIWDGLTLRLGSRGRVLATVEPDSKWPGMYRVRHDRKLTDMANKSWAKEAAVSIALRKLNGEQLSEAA